MKKLALQLMLLSSWILASPVYSQELPEPYFSFEAYRLGAVTAEQLAGHLIEKPEQFQESILKIRSWVVKQKYDLNERETRITLLELESALNRAIVAYNQKAEESRKRLLVIGAGAGAIVGLAGGGAIARGVMGRSPSCSSLLSAESLFRTSIMMGGATMGTLLGFFSGVTAGQNYYQTLDSQSLLDGPGRR